MCLSSLRRACRKLGGHDDLFAERQGLDRAVLVVRPFAVLGLTEFERRFFLVKVEHVGDDHAAGRTGKGCFCSSLWPICLHVMIFESHEMQATGFQTVIQEFRLSQSGRLSWTPGRLNPVPGMRRCP
jgi:hypothetical protein